MMNVLLISVDPKVIEYLRQPRGESPPLATEVQSSIGDLESFIESSRKYDTIVIDLAAVPADPGQLYERLDERATVTLGDEHQEQQLLQITGRYDTYVLVKDQAETYLTILPRIIRQVARDRDRDLSTSESIRNALQRHEHLLQSIPDIVYKLDPQGYFTFVNQAVTSLGYQPEELIGTHFSSLLHPDDRDRVSRSTLLPSLEGTATGPDEAPKLFDERRGLSRATRGLEVRLHRKRRGGEEEGTAVGSIIAYGEVSATGQYTREKQQTTFTGTVGIIRDVTARKKSEQLLHLFSVVLEQSPTGICIADQSLKVVYANPRFNRIHGIAYENIQKTRIAEVWNRAFSAPEFSVVIDAAERDGYWEGDLKCKGAREVFWTSLKVYPVQIFGATSHYVCLQDDISEKKEAEQQLHSELEEKKELLQEVHHRVKNNLTLISSLLNMQSAQISRAEELEKLLLASQNRIFSMALVHDQLYTSESFSQISILSYIETIVSELHGIYGSDKKIRINLDVDEGHFGLNEAIPCGLILNELISNAFKHAFDQGEEGTITIEYHRSEQAVDMFVIQDNGRGLPEGFSASSAESLGMQLIYTLAEQLGGSIELKWEDGTRVEFLLPSISKNLPYSEATSSKDVKS